MPIPDTKMSPIILYNTFKNKKLDGADNHIKILEHADYWHTKNKPIAMILERMKEWIYYI